MTRRHIQSSRVFLLCVILSASSCVSRSAPFPVQTREAHLYALIEERIHEEDYASLFMLLQSEAADEFLPQYRREELYEEVQRLMTLSIEAARANDDYARILDIAGDFETLGLSVPYDENEIGAEYARDFFARDLPAAGFPLLRDLPLELFSDEEIAEFLALAYEDRRISDLRYLQEEARRRAMPVPYGPATVDIEALGQATVTLFTTDITNTRVSEGSGFFVENGFVLTSYHVVQGLIDPRNETEIQLYVEIFDPIPARVYSYDALLDVALVRVEIDAPQVLSLSQESPRIGQKVFALGTSLGTFARTLTLGIVSSRRHILRQIAYELQLDAPTHPGSSGGAVLNEQGEVVGVLLTSVSEFEGISFAIPAEWILHILPQLFERSGELQYSWIGLAGREVSDGIEVIYVMPESSATMAGLETGDVIREIQGEPVRNILELQEQLLSRGAGTLVALKLRRGTRYVETAVKLMPRPRYPALSSLEVDTIQRFMAPLLGVEIRMLKTSRSFLSFEVREVSPETPGAGMQLAPGDILGLREWILVPQERLILLSLQVLRKIDGYIVKSMQVPVSYLVRNFF